MGYVYIFEVKRSTKIRQYLGSTAAFAKTFMNVTLAYNNSKGPLKL